MADPTMADPTQTPTSAMAMGLVDPSLTGGQYLNPSYATPQQRAHLYAMSQQLMQPPQIKNGWQGLGAIANALVGGYMGHQADVQEQASQAQDKGDFAKTAGAILAPNQAAPTVGAAPAASSAPNTPTSAPVAGAASAPPDGMSAKLYAAAVAPQYGVDPKAATAMVDKEYGDGSAYSGDGGSSFGPMQLHYGGVNPKMPGNGLGDDFTAKTGLDARNPANWKQTIDFGLASAAKQGWQPWATSRDKLGFSNYTGINSAPVAPHDQSAAIADIAAKEKAAGTGGTITPAQAVAIATGGAPSSATSSYAPPAPTAPAPAVAAINAAANPGAAQSPAIAALAAALRGQPTAPPADPRLALAAGLTGQMPAPSPMSVAQLSGVDRLSPAAAASPRAAPAVPVAPSAATPPANPPLPPVRPPGLGVAPPVQPAPVAPMAYGAPTGAALDTPAFAAIRNGASPPGAGASPQPQQPPPQIAQNAPASGLPVSAAAIGELLGNRNIDPATKQAVLAQLAPKAMTDVQGNTSISYQNQPPQAPMFHAGTANELSIGADGSIHAPVIVPPNGGTLSLANAIPLGPTNGRQPGGSPLGPIIDLSNAVRQNNIDQNNIAARKTAWTQQATDAQQKEIQLKNNALPLYQLKGLIDSNPDTPMGVGADKAMNWSSAANFITGLLGHPLDADADNPKTMSTWQLFNKYGTMLQQKMAGDIGIKSNEALESAGHTSPGIDLSPVANKHLIDNLIRLNDLNIKYNHDYQSYYNNPANHGDMSAWNDSWINSISGKHSVPLSKFPLATADAPDGTYIKLPATDPSGFWWYKKGEIK